MGSLVIFKSSLPDEMAVAKLVPEVAMSDRFRVSIPYPFDADKRAEHCKMRDGIVQSREKAVHGMYADTGMNIDACTSSTWADHISGPGRFEGLRNRCPDSDDPAFTSVCRIDGVGRCG